MNKYAQWALVIATLLCLFIGASALTIAIYKIAEGEKCTSSVIIPTPQPYGPNIEYCFTPDADPLWDCIRKADYARVMYREDI